MKTQIYLTLAVIACFSFSGCAVKNSMRLSGKDSQWNPLAKLTEERAAKKDEQTRPESMAAIWKDSVLEKPGIPPVRGFGGRIYFYDNENRAVKADGELIVYGFDEDKKITGDPKADRKYVFQAEKFQTHHSETDIGDSYSVWIPWEKIGGIRKSITLIPIFKTDDGRVLKSGQSINVLPGKKPAFVENTGPKLKTKTGVVQAGFESETDDEEFNKPRLRTTSIKLTPAMAQRMNAPIDNASKQTATKQNEDVDQPVESSIRKTVSHDSESSGKNSTSSSTESVDSSDKAAQRTVFGSPGTLR